MLPHGARLPSRLLMPVAGEVVRPFGAALPGGEEARGLRHPADLVDGHEGAAFVVLAGGVAGFAGGPGALFAAGVAGAEQREPPPGIPVSRTRLF